MPAVTNIVVTGAMQTGKSSLVQRLLSRFPKEYAGLFCTPVYVKGQRVGFGLQQAGATDIDVFAHIDWGENRFGVFGINLTPFERAADYVEKNRDLCKFFIIDEIGIFEKDVESYQDAIESLLNSTLTTVLVVQKRADYFWQKLENRNDMTIFNLDEKDHAVAEKQIAEILEKVTDTDGSVDIKIR